VTGRDPLAEWGFGEFLVSNATWGDPEWVIYHQGANDRLDALRPLIAAAEQLATAVLEIESADYMPAQAAHLARIVRDLTTPKGDKS
jgi:hypothetical protein